MAIKVGGPLAVNNSFSVYELFVLDAEGNAISVGYGTLDSKGMLVSSYLELRDAKSKLNEMAEAKPHE